MNVTQRMFTVEEIQAQVEEYAVDTHDHLAQSTNLTFNSGHLSYLEDGDGPLFDTATHQDGKLTDQSYTQVVGRLDGPDLKWLTQRCPLSLADKIMNALAQEYRDPARFLIRHKGSTVRAVLSDQYTKLDNIKLVPMVAKALGIIKEQTGVNGVVMRPIIGDHLSMYVLLPDFPVAVDPRQHYIGGQNGVLYPGAHVGNDETGHGGVWIQSAVFTGICNNGAIFGWQEETDIRPFIRHRWIDEAALQHLVSLNLGEALKMSDAAIKMYVESYTISMGEEQLLGMVNEYRAKYGLLVSESQSWLGAVATEVGQRGDRQITLGDVVNGLTVQAHATKDPIRGELFERIAGDALTERLGNGLFGRNIHQRAPALVWQPE